MKIGICNDHAGVEYKFKLVKMLQKQGIEVVNFGTDTPDSVDYPDFARRMRPRHRHLRNRQRHGHYPE